MKGDYIRFLKYETKVLGFILKKGWINYWFCLFPSRHMRVFYPVLTEM